MDLRVEQRPGTALTQAGRFGLTAPSPQSPLPLQRHLHSELPGVRGINAYGQHRDRSSIDTLDRKRHRIARCRADQGTREWQPGAGSSLVS
jgi:hypothetical protein